MEDRRRLRERISPSEMDFGLIERYRGVPVVWTMPLLNNRYHVFDIDLTVVHNDAELGLREWLESRKVEYATFLAIIEAPSEYFYKVNTPSAPRINAVVGDEWEDFEIREIFYSNVAGVGTGQIYVEWREP